MTGRPYDHLNKNMKIRKTYKDGESVVQSFKTEAEAMTQFNNEKSALKLFVEEPMELECADDYFAVWEDDQETYKVTLIG